MTTNTITLTTSPRVAKKNKKDGFLPAVYYGANAKSTPIFVDTIEFGKVLKKAGESTAIVLVTEHGNENVMIQDVQLDPVKNIPSHVDFYVIEKGQKVHVKTPIVFVGESLAVKNGGVLVKVLHELSIEGDPTAIPHEITIDISVLTSNDSVVTAKDIVLPKGVTLYHLSEDEVLASIAIQKEEVDTPTEVDLSAIEVEKKGKKEEVTEDEK